MPLLSPDRQPLSVELLQPDCSFARTRVHDFHEINVVLRGVYRVQVAGEELTLGSGSALLYPRGLEHLPGLADGRNLTLLHIAWQDATDHGGRHHVVPGPSQRLLTAARWLHDRFTCAEGADSACGHLLELLIDEITGAGGTAIEDPLDGLRREIAASYARPHSLASLAAMVGMPPHRLREAFRRRFGCTPNTWLRQVRVEAALVMLRERQHDLDSIARRCGFGRASYLSRVIAQDTGRPPSSWRNGG